MPKRSNNKKCSFCGRDIRYRTYGGTRYAVEGNEINFLPDTLVGDTLFINKSGSVIFGHKVNDGQIGYRLHDCQGVYANKKAAHVGERG